MEKINRNDLDFSCFVIGTTLNDRLENMLTTLKTIDSQHFSFKKKILSLDDFGEGLNEEIKNYTNMNNWLVLCEVRGGMVENQLRALNKIETEWVLYCEDDVIVEKIEGFPGLPFVFGVIIVAPPPPTVIG